MKKILKALGIILLLLIAAVIAIPYLFQDKIVAFVKTELNSQLNANADWKDYNLSLFSSFPDLKFNLNQFSIEGQGQFDSLVFVSANNASLTFDLKSVISGEEYKVKSLSIDQLVLNAIVLEDGTANYDIMKEEFDTDTTVVQEDAYPYKILLEDYSIKNSKIIYDNRSLGAYLEIDGLNHSGSGSLSDQFYNLTTKTSVNKTNVEYGGISYLKDAEASIDAKFNISDEFRQYDLLENDIRVNDLHLMADGEVYMPEDGINFDIDYKTTQTDLLTLLSLVPASYMPPMDGLESNGSVDLHGSVKGMYGDNSLPGIVVDASIKDGYLQYPDLPENIEDIELAVLVNIPEGNDFGETSINVSKFHMDLADNPIDATLLVKSALSDDPFIKSEIKSSLDFASVKEAIPLGENDQLNGSLTADVDLEGNLSAVQNQEYDKFKATGEANLIGFLYTSDSIPFDTEIKSAYLKFSPQQLNLSEFDSKIGDTEISATGAIDNYLAWFLKDEVLHGRFEVESGYIDVADFMPEMESAESTESQEEEIPLSVIEVPANVDIDLKAKIDGLKYDKVDIKNVNGNIAIKDSKAEMKNVRMELLNGSVVLNGSYDTKNPKKPQVDFNYQIDDMGISESASSFNTVNTLAPIAKRCQGSFDSGLNFSTALNENMEPIYETMNGNGNAFTQSVLIQNFEPLSKIATTLKLDQFAEQAIKNVKLKFAFENGRVNVDPFDVKIDGMDANVAGSTGFEGDMDYNMKLKVPTEKFGSDVNQWVGSVLGKAGDLGLDASLGEFVNVNLKITGTIDNPQIKPVFDGVEGQSLKETIETKVEEVVKEELIDPAKEKAKEEAEKILADAQAQADKLVAEAEKTAAQIRKEADTQGNKLVNDAKNPLAKLAAEKAAKKLRQEADKKADQVVATAEKKSKDIMTKAQTEADAKLQ